MTTEIERSRAVYEVGEAIKKLAYNLKQDTEVLQISRKEIRDLDKLLRHYPFIADINKSARVCPDVWAKIEWDDDTSKYVFIQENNHE